MLKGTIWAMVIPKSEKNQACGLNSCQFMLEDIKQLSVEASVKNSLICHAQNSIKL